MQRYRRPIPLLAISLVAALISSQGIANRQPDQQGALPSMPELSVSPPPSVTKSNNPKPKPAQKAILGLFEKYEVVGMNVDHGAKDLNDFILALIRNPEFPNKVNDIAVEGGNSHYQPILDRYILGENVSFAEVRSVWRNTTQVSFGLSNFYEEFFPLVRQINKALPREKKLRVLAGDSAIEWDKVKTRQDLKLYGGKNRDTTIASVMENEVLSKHRKALMLFGVFHLFHGMNGSAVEIYEKRYPNLTYIISDYSGFGQRVPSASKYNDELTKRIASWSVPSLVNVKGTWLADMDFAYFFPPLLIGQPNGKLKAGFPQGLSSFSKAVDGFLYLGPSDLLLSEHIPTSVYMDQDYLSELRRRGAIMNDGGALENILENEKSSGSGE